MMKFNFIETETHLTSNWQKLLGRRRVQALTLLNYTGEKIININVECMFNFYVKFTSFSPLDMLPTLHIVLVVIFPLSLLMLNLHSKHFTCEICTESTNSNMGSEIEIKPGHCVAIAPAIITLHSSLFLT